MNIAFVAAEVYPFAKTGGLADVAGSLPLALGRLGHRVLVVMPKVRGVKVLRQRLSARVLVAFVRHEGYFNRPGLYGNARGDYPDNLERFVYFCRQTLRLFKALKFRPDVVHTNDWHTGPVGVLLKDRCAGDPFFEKTRSLFTIHNLAYQGLFPAGRARRVWPEIFRSGAARKLERKGRICLIKGGIEFSDAVSTVSSTHALEIQTRGYGCGLERVLRRRRGQVHGILNGIDTEIWDPRRDGALDRCYSAGTPARRRHNKAGLQRICGFEEDARTPVLGMVSRLAGQKGVDLVIEAFEALMKKRVRTAAGLRGVQFVLLGTGEARYERFFRGMARRYRGRAACFLKFSDFRASMIYAGCDFFLVPSRYEPCGLSQMIAFRYGAVPIARRTGGLADTVTDADRDPRRGNGILFERYGAKAFLGAVDRALRLYGDAARMERLRRRGMRQDFTWRKSAREYEKLYKGLMRRRPGGRRRAR